MDGRRVQRPNSAYHPPSMRPVFLLIVVVVLFRCAAPPPPEVTPEPAPPPAPVVEQKQEDEVIGAVRVTASSLNVRAEASTEASIITQVKKGQTLDVLREDESWVKVKLASGETGWVAARFVSRGNAQATAAKRPATKGGCPPDSDYAITEAPPLAFSDRGAHGLVVVEATVNAKGVVTATKLVSNGTGDEALGFLAEREIRGAKFSPPIRNCAPRPFIFTYRRTF